jgi:peptidoglycan hydrolase-like protein with peptidoglycan-binding domain
VLYGTGKQSPSMYTSLQRGDSGERVRNLQYTLYELGYYDGSIDGDYGQTTEDAVKAFQIRNSVEPVDGIAGKVTMSVLYSSDAKAATTPEDFESVGPGATGEIVQEIQDCLIERQYMTNDQRSSTYDDITTAAVRQFQQDNNMQVDGICGKQTLELLFGSIQLD